MDSPQTSDGNEPVADHDETRLRILLAAEEEFAHAGYEAATIRNICKRADVRNIGAINYYFGGKQDLYTEAVKFALAHCSNQEMPPGMAEMPPRERLRHFIHGMLRSIMLAERASARILWMRETGNPTDACRSAVEAQIRPSAHELMKIVQELVPGVSAERHWQLGFSVVGQILLYGQCRPILEILMGKDDFDRMAIDRIADHIDEFCAAALERIATFTPEEGS